MYKRYSDSYLMTKNKKTLIEYLRVAEHNHMACDETINQQAKNCMELLEKERANGFLEGVTKTFEAIKVMLKNGKSIDDIELLIKEQTNDQTESNT